MAEKAIVPVELRDFPPVPPLTEVPETYRQTFLAKQSECPRSAYLYLKYRGGPRSHPLARGTLFHRFAERVIRTLIEEDEAYMPPDLAKSVLSETIRESTDLVVPPAEQDSLRAMAQHFADGFMIEDREAVLCVETPVELDVNGRLVTGTIDFAELTAPGVVRIKDWKTAFLHYEYEIADPAGVLPTTKEWQGSFQTVLYSMALALGRIKGLPRLEGIHTFEVQLVHPRYFWEAEQTMAYRTATVTREQLTDLWAYLENLVAQTDEALHETWNFPAVHGSHCDYCPASSECPIPAALRNYRGEVRTEEDAVRAATMRDKAQARYKELDAALKGYTKLPGNTPLRYGKDYVLVYDTVEKKALAAKKKVEGAGVLTGREALLLDVEAATEYGQEFDPNDHFKPQISTTLKRKTLSEHEILAEREAQEETDERE